MPECLLFAYAEQKQRIEAGRLRDLSMVAAFPHMTKSGARSWLDGLRKAGRQMSHAADSLFMFNGQAISVRGLRDRLGRALGRGFSSE